MNSNKFINNLKSIKGLRPLGGIYVISTVWIACVAHQNDKINYDETMRKILNNEDDDQDKDKNVSTKY
jgi:hypothetical protein